MSYGNPYINLATENMTWHIFASVTCKKIKYLKVILIPKIKKKTLHNETFVSLQKNHLIVQMRFQPLVSI